MALALNTDIPPQHQQTSFTFRAREQEQSESNVDAHARAESPQPLPRPPVSPISPSASLAQPARTGPSSSRDPHTATSYNSIAPPPPPPSQNQKRSQHSPRVPPPPQTQFIDPPAPLPINVDDNTDAAALRAAISILQIQRDKSRHDIKTLQELKQGLIKDPDNFTQELLAGRLREEKRPDDPLQATFSGASEEIIDGDEDMSQDHEIPALLDNITPPAQSSSSQYPAIPAAQNVIRCPPVNWAKYHIAGEPLDRMHEEQRKRPSLGDPAHDYAHQQQHPYAYGMPPSASMAAEHHIYAPYDPSRDRTTTTAEQMGIVGVQTRRSSKKPEQGPWAAGAGQW